MIAKHKRQDVAIQRVSEHSWQVNENLSMLPSVVPTTVVFCARQNIPFRGHRNEAHAAAGSGEGNPGNLPALMKFRAAAGDPHCQADNTFYKVRAGGKPVRYSSSRIQNDLIECSGAVLLESIIAEVKVSPFFSVLADETSDCANLEQMPIVLRFVDMASNICEEFVGFALCDEGTSGACLSAVILSFLEKLGLDSKKLRGQGYDGAGNMAGI